MDARNKIKQQDRSDGRLSVEKDSLLKIFDEENSCRFGVSFTEDMNLPAVAIGAGFATFENCCYILTAGAESLPYILIRGMAVGVMHIVSILALPIWLIAARRLLRDRIPDAHADRFRAVFPSTQTAALYGIINHALSLCKTLNLKKFQKKVSKIPKKCD